MKRLGKVSFILALAVTLLVFSAALANGLKTIYAKALDDHECNSSEWHFVINQIDSEANAPSSIHVEWANGNSEDVSRGAFTGGVAHYTTTSNLGSTVTSASAQIYASWDGQFNLSHGPCAPPPPPGECNDDCECSGDCEEGLTCYEGKCRNPDCPTEEDCACPEEPAECNEPPTSAGCVAGLTVYEGLCRNPACPTEEDCECPPTPGECNDDCECSGDCEEGLFCYEGKCRNPDCPTEENCACPEEPAECNEPPTSAGCVAGLTVYEGVCRNPDCPEETDCICPIPPPGCWDSCSGEGECPEGLECLWGKCRNPDCPDERDCDCDWPSCWPRKNVTITGCIPQGLAISQWIDFSEEVGSEPDGKMISDRLWLGETLLFDLDYESSYRFWSWSGEGWIYLFDETTSKKCEVFDNSYHFPCPVPEELPVTGFTPEPVMNLGPLLTAAAGLSLIGIGLALKRRQ